jgi:hypothetical protein
MEKNNDLRLFTYGNQVSEEYILGCELKAAHRSLKLLREALGTEKMNELLKDYFSNEETVLKYTGYKEGCKFTKESFATLEIDGAKSKEVGHFIVGNLMALNQQFQYSGHPEHFGFLKGDHPGTIKIHEAVGHTTPPLEAIMKFVSQEEFGKEYCISSNPAETMYGNICLANGTVIGKAMHEFEDTDTGCRIYLKVFWPEDASDEMAKGHSDHFLVEFRNWVLLYRLQKEKEN